MAFSNAIMPALNNAEQPGGPALGALASIYRAQGQNAQNQILNAQAQYAPQQAQANAFLTQQQARFLPYQQSMSILSNPMAWATAQESAKNGDPSLMNQMSNMMRNMPNMGQMGGQGNQLMQLNPSSSPGIFGSLLQKLGLGASSSQNAMQNIPSSNAQGMGTPNQSVMGNDQSSSQGTPIVPSTEGGSSGVVGKMTAAYNQSPYKAGVSIADPNNPGDVISVPSTRQVTDLQKQIAATTRTIPQLKSLPDAWSPFMTAEGYKDLYAAKAGNFLQGALSPETIKSMGLSTDSDLPSKYADAKLSSLTSVESYLKSIGVPVTVDVQKQLNHDIEPQIGETQDSYHDRMQAETQRIVKDFASQAFQQLKMGYQSSPEAYPTLYGNQDQNNPQSPAAQNIATKQAQIPKGAWPLDKLPENANDLEGQRPPAGNVWMVRPDGQQVPVHLSNVQMAKDKYKYRGIND